MENRSEESSLGGSGGGYVQDSRASSRTAGNCAGGEGRKCLQVAEGSWPGWHSGISVVIPLSLGEKRAALQMVVGAGVLGTRADSAPEPCVSQLAEGALGAVSRGHRVAGTH